MMRKKGMRLEEEKDEEQFSVKKNYQITEKLPITALEHFDLEF